jgi:hypothetical protein
LTKSRFATCTADSPDAAHVIVVEHAVVADDCHVFELCLRDQHAIERVTMVAGQRACSLRVQDGDV